MVDILKRFLIIIGAIIIGTLSIPMIFAGPSDDNHVHIEQVGGGDNLNINVEQIGYGNLIQFSTDHGSNTFNLSQKGAGNTISWVPWWGSGKSWGGDVDGTNNNISIDQENGATYGAHVWGNYNDVDVYQNGDHETYLDIHASYTETDVWQEGQGGKYSRVYYYGNTNNSEVDLMQKGSGQHSAYITLTGNYLTTLNLTQQGATNQSYNLTQNCQTVGGCSVTVTQGN